MLLSSLSSISHQQQEQEKEKEKCSHVMMNSNNAHVSNDNIMNEWHYDTNVNYTVFSPPINVQAIVPDNDIPITRIIVAMMLHVIMQWNGYYVHRHHHLRTLLH